MLLYFTVYCYDLNTQRLKIRGLAVFAINLNPRLIRKMNLLVSAEINKLLG